MAISPSHFSIVFLSLLFLIFTSPKPTNSNPNSAYDVLTSHGLPIGIFPTAISDFSLDPSSGRFELHLTQSPCDAKFETHVRYDWNVSGTITYGQIAGLSGIAAQDLFLWFPVKGIHVDIPSSGLIYFDVGVVSKQFSLSFFETPRDCTIPPDDDKLSSPVDLKFLDASRARVIEMIVEEVDGDGGVLVRYSYSETWSDD